LTARLPLRGKRVGFDNNVERRGKSLEERITSDMSTGGEGGRVLELILVGCER
jgi:hypothetical protein